jgi:hypothetical protein
MEIRKFEKRDVNLIVGRLILAAFPELWRDVRRSDKYIRVSAKKRIARALASMGAITPALGSLGGGPEEIMARCIAAYAEAKPKTKLKNTIPTTEG